MSEAGAAVGEEGLSRTVRRQRVLLIVAVVAAVLAIGGLVASLFVKSPAQHAAEQAPPPASVLSEAVRRGELVSSITVRGTVEAPETLAVPALGGDSGTRIVTSVTHPPGSEIAAGGVLMEISARPVLAFAGEIPVYRDLKVNDVGVDVQQLQQGLASLGYLDASVITSRFDSWTQAALEAYYTDLGYPSTGEGSSLSLPLSEYAFLPTLPARVATVEVKRGAIIASGDTILTVKSGEPRVVAVVPSGQEKGIAANQKVEVIDEVGARKAQGSVIELGPYDDGRAGQAAAGTGEGPVQGAPAAPQAGPVASPGYPLSIKTNESLGAEWLGASVRILIEEASSDGEVLIVPSSAIALADDGTTSVIVLGTGGERRTVPVRTGLSVDGSVQVTALDEAELEEGEKVIVG